MKRIGLLFKKQQKSPLDGTSKENPRRFGKHSCRAEAYRDELAGEDVLTQYFGQITTTVRYPSHNEIDRLNAIECVSDWLRMRKAAVDEYLSPKGNRPIKRAYNRKKYTKASKNNFPISRVRG